LEDAVRYPNVVHFQTIGHAMPRTIQQLTGSRPRNIRVAVIVWIFNRVKPIIADCSPVVLGGIRANTIPYRSTVIRVTPQVVNVAPAVGGAMFGSVI
jgi:hypothetical protein